MFQVKYVYGHYQVYNQKGCFLFSADNEKEVQEELEEYAEFTA